MNDRRLASKILVDGCNPPECNSPTNIKSNSNSASPHSRGLGHWSSTPTSQIKTSKNFLALPSPTADRIVAISIEDKKEDAIDPQVEKLAQLSLKINTTTSYLKQQAVAVSPHAPAVTKRYHSEEQERKYMQQPLISVNRSLTFFKQKQQKDNTLNGKLRRLLDSCNFKPGSGYP